MKKSYLLTGIALSLLVAGGASVYESPVSSNIVAKADDTQKSGNLLGADSGTGVAGNALSNINNYPESNSGHVYSRNMKTMVFHLDLKDGFNQGGTITLSPDYSNNKGSDVPLILSDAYLYNKKDGSFRQIMQDENIKYSDFNLKKVGKSYTLDVPADENISDYSLVFTIKPLNSFEAGDNEYQHPSYGVNVEAKSTDGKVDGSDYTSSNGGWGVLWGQYNTGDINNVLINKHTDTVQQGDSYDLASQVTNTKDYDSSSWVVRDSDGNKIDTNNIGSLPLGDYYATFYGKKGEEWAWDTVKVTVVKPTPKPTPTPTPNPSPEETGMVTIKYMDIYGNKLSADKVLSGKVGDSFSTTSKNISGYSLTKTVGIENGVYSKDNQTVSYLYTKEGTDKVKKGQAVYAINKIGLYSSVNFSKSNRKVWYYKESRTNRPMFVVTGYKTNFKGILRYQVKDVNHGSKTSGLTGYVTANNKYVVPAYYSSLPKSRKVAVINKTGINSYKNFNLSGKVSHYKKGTVLKVVKTKKHNLTTRYVLSDGSYITANKKLIKIK